MSTAPVGSAARTGPTPPPPSGRATQTERDAPLIADDRLNVGGLLGLEQSPDATIKGVQAEVHEAGEAEVMREGTFVDARPDDRPGH